MGGQAEINEIVFKVWGLGLLAFARIAMIMIQAPIWGSKHYNKKVRVGAAGLLTILAFPNLPMPEYFPTEILGFMLAIMGQVVVGLAIGFASFTVMACAMFGGEMMDIQMGLSVAATVDPSTGGASKLIMRLNFYIAMLLYLTFNGHHQLLIALFKSFELVPLTHFSVRGEMVVDMIRMVGDIFQIGVRIAAPALAALFVAQVALGLLARVAPQMNVFMISFPLNIAIGLVMFSVGLPAIMSLELVEFDRCLQDVFRTIGFMQPDGFVPRSPAVWPLAAPEMVVNVEYFNDGFMETLVTETLGLILTLSAPMLVAAIGTGLLVSIFQATTQVQEQTLSFVPKIVATFVAVIMSSSYITSNLVEFTVRMLRQIQLMGPG